MAKSVAEVEKLAENIIDEVMERIEDGDDRSEAIYEVAHDTADSEVYYPHENWDIVNEFYNSKHYQQMYDVDYEICETTIDVFKLLQETAYCIVSGILTTILQEKIEDEE